MPSDRNHPEFSRGYAYVDFESGDDADKAVQHMNGGWLAVFVIIIIIIIIIIRFPSNLRPTTCIDLHVVTSSQRNKDGSHSIRHAIAENPMLRTNLLAWFYRNSVMANQSFTVHCRNRDFNFPWPWPDDLHIWTWPVFPGDIMDVQIWISYIKALESYCLTNRQTRPKLHTTPLRGWSVIIW